MKSQVISNFNVDERVIELNVHPAAPLFSSQLRKGSGVIKHRGEVDCTIMPHWPTVNEVIPFITAQSGTAGCSLPPSSTYIPLASRHTSPLLSAAVRGRSRVVRLNGVLRCHPDGTDRGELATQPPARHVPVFLSPDDFNYILSNCNGGQMRRRGAANSIDQNNFYNCGNQ